MNKLRILGFQTKQGTKSKLECEKLNTEAKKHQYSNRQAKPQETQMLNLIKRRKASRNMIEVWVLRHHWFEIWIDLFRIEWHLQTFKVAAIELGFLSQISKIQHYPIKEYGYGFWVLGSRLLLPKNLAALSINTRSVEGSTTRIYAFRILAVAFYNSSKDEIKSPGTSGIT
jgi:hypothetical protein